MFKKSFLLFLFVIFPAMALAETGPLGWGVAKLTQAMETDRPDFTEGTQPVQPGHLQLESGYTYIYDDEDRVESHEHVIPEFLFRIGLFEDFEARVVWGGYINSDVDDRSEDGVTDMSLGYKHRLLEEDGLLPALSYIAEFSIPVGSDEFSSDEVEPALKILWAYDVDGIAIAGNVNFAGPIADDDSRYFETSASFTVGTGVCEGVGVYAEYFGFYSVEEAEEHFANGGFTWAVSETLQWDIRAGLGLNEPAADFFAGAGFSYLL